MLLAEKNLTVFHIFKVHLHERFEDDETARAVTSTDISSLTYLGSLDVQTQ
jgi:hypothetical protein